MNKEKIEIWAFNNCNIGGEIDLTELVAFLENIKIYDKNGRIIEKNYNKVWDKLNKLQKESDSNE